MARPSSRSKSGPTREDWGFPHSGGQAFSVRTHVQNLGENHNATPTTLGTTPTTLGTTPTTLDVLYSPLGVEGQGAHPRASGIRKQVGVQCIGCEGKLGIFVIRGGGGGRPFEAVRHGVPNRGLVVRIPSCISSCIHWGCTIRSGSPDLGMGDGWGRAKEECTHLQLQFQSQRYVQVPCPGFLIERTYRWAKTTGKGGTSLK